MMLCTGLPCRPEIFMTSQMYMAATQARNIYDIIDVMYAAATQARYIHDITDC